MSFSMSLLSIVTVYIECVVYVIDFALEHAKFMFAEQGTLRRTNRTFWLACFAAVFACTSVLAVCDKS